MFCRSLFVLFPVNAGHCIVFHSHLQIADRVSFIFRFECINDDPCRLPRSHGECCLTPNKTKSAISWREQTMYNEMMMISSLNLTNSLIGSP
jgi:hypothetical protein